VGERNRLVNSSYAFGAVIFVYVREDCRDRRQFSSRILFENRNTATQWDAFPHCTSGVIECRVNCSNSERPNSCMCARVTYLEHIAELVDSERYCTACREACR